MFAEKRARVLTAACGLAATLLLATFAHAQQVFVDHFNNGSVTDSDSVPGFWQIIPNDDSTVTEAPSGPITFTAQSTGTAGDNYPFAEISSTSLLSEANFFQQPIVLSVSGLNYNNSLTTALTEFNFGSQLTVPDGTVQTEYNEPSDFSLEICEPNGANGELIMGEKANAPNKSTPFDIYELIGPTGHVTTGTQNLGGQVRSFELVLSSQYYYLSVISDTSPTNSTPVTTIYSGGLDLMNTGTYPWTTGTYAPGDPELNIETQINDTTNGTDQASLNIGSLSLSQLNMIYTNAAGDGNYFTAGNWSGLNGVIDPTTAANLKITVPDYASAAATFPQATSPTTVSINNGNGNTITVGTLNFNSTQPYTINGSIVQFATSGSTDQINVTAGDQTINAELLFYDANSNFNVASNASLTVNGPVESNAAMGLNTGAGPVTITGNVISNGAMTISSGAGPLTINGDFASAGAITLNAGSGGMTINPGTTNDFLFHGPLTLNVASGGTLTINSYIDDPLASSSPATGTYPVSKTGPGTATVASLYLIPSVTVSGGLLRIAPSPTANSYLVGGSYINALTLSGGKLDLTNNEMVIDYTGASPLTTIRGYLQTGVLYSSTASLALGTHIAYAEATEIGQTNGFNPQNGGSLYTDSTSICLMYAYDGDLNMDGTVDAADYALMVSGNGSDWYNGDLNYDGVKNADDWSLFQLGLAVSGGKNINNLPEPGSLAMLGAAAFGLIRRRKPSPAC